jgi:DNA-binding NarL/FixJ family response regulator
MAEPGSTLLLDQMLAGLGPALFSSIRMPFGIFDRDRRIVWINETMAAIHRCEPEKVVLEQRLSEKKGGRKSVTLDGGKISLSVKLSRRETDVLRLITEGYTNAQVSELLDISANTVKSYVNNLFNKLGVNDRTQAAVLATRHHII